MFKLLTYFKFGNGRLFTNGCSSFFRMVMKGCLEMFTKGAYLTPSEKHVLVKNMGFSLFLMDWEGANINELCRPELPLLDRVFKDVQYVPLFGDMQVTFFECV